MKLKQVKLQNFRCYQEETTIDLGDLVVLVGRNDAGKSSILDALDIFFEGRSAPDRDDVCVHSASTDVRITCVFSEFPSQIVIDAQFPTDLASEYLLNSDGLLEVSKVYNCALSRPKCSGIFARAVHPTAGQYGDLLSLTNTKLKERASSLGIDLRAVNKRVNTELRRAIWGHANDLQERGILVELKSEAAKAIGDQLKKSFPVYALFKSDRPSTDQDAEAQDPMKAAVKEAIRENEAILSQIAERVKEEVQEIANRTVDKIKEMDPQLANQLTPRVSNKNWDTLFSVNLTGDGDVSINKRGSGTRRLVLLNFFRAKVEEEAEGNAADSIYAIEEPETSQHPHNQVMLVKALEDLAERPGCQVFLSTHTPVLARRFSQETLRLVTKQEGRPVIRHGCDEETLGEIVKSLGVLPDHGVRFFFGVEGRNDINFLRNISKILKESGENIPDLSQDEDAGRLVFVPLGGSNISLWVSRLEGFGRPEFYLMDRDNPPSQKSKYHDIAAQLQARENCTAWTTGGKELENYIHPNVIRDIYPHYKGSGDKFENVPLLFAQAVHEASESDATWEEVLGEQKKFEKKISSSKRRLNDEFVSKMTPDLLSEVDQEGEVRLWLRTVGNVLES